MGGAGRGGDLMPSRKPVIEIGEVAPQRPTALIYGELYELRLPDEFGIEFQSDLIRRYKTILEWQDAEDIETPENAAFLSKTLHGFCREVIIGPPEWLFVRDDSRCLTDAQALSLVLAFGKVVAMPTPTLPRQQRRRPQTGGKQSRASRGSTEVVHKTG